MLFDRASPSAVLGHHEFDTFLNDREAPRGGRRLLQVWPISGAMAECSRSSPADKLLRRPSAQTTAYVRCSLPLPFVDARVDGHIRACYSFRLLRLEPGEGLSTSRNSPTTSTSSGNGGAHRSDNRRCTRPCRCAGSERLKARSRLSATQVGCRRKCSGRFAGSLRFQACSIATIAVSDIFQVSPLSFHVKQHDK